MLQLTAANPIPGSNPGAVGVLLQHHVRCPNPPPKAPKKKPRHFESSEEDAPPPEAQTKPKAKPKPKGKGKGKATPPQPKAPPLEDRGRGPYGNVPGVGDTRYVPWKEGGTRPSDSGGGWG